MILLSRLILIHCDTHLILEIRQERPGHVVRLSVGVLQKVVEVVERVERVVPVRRVAPRLHMNETLSEMDKTVV